MVSRNIYSNIQVGYFSHLASSLSKRDPYRQLSLFWLFRNPSHYSFTILFIQSDNICRKGEQKKQSMNQSYHHLPIIYSEQCPEEPIVTKLSKDRYLSPGCPVDHHHSANRSKKPISRKQQVDTFYTPKILKQKSQSSTYQMKEHQRQLESMKKRIRECKSLQQRIKDKNDPLVHPPYFIRNQARASEVRIDGFSRKIAVLQHTNSKNPRLRKFKGVGGMNQEKSKCQSTAIQHSLEKRYGKVGAGEEEETEMPCPAFGHKFVHEAQRPHQISSPALEWKHRSQEPSQVLSILKAQQRYQPSQQGQQEQQPGVLQTSKTIPNAIDLPECNLKSILDHIYHRLLHRDEDLGVLRFRLCHTYGKKQVEKTWKAVIHLLGRD